MTAKLLIVDGLEVDEWSGRAESPGAAYVGVTVAQLVRLGV